MVKRLPAMWETQDRSLGREDPLEKEMATHSSTVAWKISWTEDRGSLQSMGFQSQTQLSDFTFTFTCSGIKIMPYEYFLTSTIYAIVSYSAQGHYYVQIALFSDLF